MCVGLCNTDSVCRRLVMYVNASSKRAVYFYQKSPVVSCGRIGGRLCNKDAIRRGRVTYVNASIKRALHSTKRALLYNKRTLYCLAAVIA